MSWLRRCCLAVALTLVASTAILAQSTTVADPGPPPANKTVDRAALSLFPIRTLWTLALANQITVPPTYDGTHGYFAIEHERVVAYDLNTGRRTWLVTANPQMEPAIGDGLLFLVEPQTLTALRVDDGSIAWQLPFVETLIVPPVWDNGWLVAATASNEILAFRATDGQLIWRRAIASTAHARPALAADRVYIPTEDGRIVALRVDSGEPLWERKLGGPANDILALDQRLYVGSKDKYFYCLLASDGTIDWRWRTGGDVIGLPVIDNRLVYFVSLDNVLRALHHTSGAQRWKTSLPLRPSGGPVKAGDALIVSGIAASMPGYSLIDGRAVGDVPAGGEPAAQPHLFMPQAGSAPIVIAVTRDIAKGATVTAITRAVEPRLIPIAPLPDVISMSPVTRD